MSDNHLPFVISRPDGFVGVEVGVSDQLTPDEAFELAARISACALEAKEMIEKLERLKASEMVARVAAKMGTRVDCSVCEGFGYVDTKSIRCRICKGTGKVLTSG